MAPKSLKERYPGAALITGASAGIGEAFARRLGAEGMDLILVARRQERLEKLGQELAQKHGIKAHAIPCDLGDREGPWKLHAAVQALGVEVGTLVNNAGFGTYGDFHTLDPKREAEMVDLNCRAPVALTGLFAPAMVARRRGAIIFVASVAAYQPCPYFSTYGATKTFDLVLAEALWAEMRPHKVDVIALSPGYTSTEFQQVAGVDAHAPSGGWATPDQVVATCLGKLGKKPSVIHGIKNAFLAWSNRFAPRATSALLTGRLIKKSMRKSGG